MDFYKHIAFSYRAEEGFKGIIPPISRTSSGVQMVMGYGFHYPEQVRASRCILSEYWFLNSQRVGSGGEDRNPRQRNAMRFSGITSTVRNLASDAWNRDEAHRPCERMLRIYNFIKLYVSVVDCVDYDALDRVAVGIVMRNECCALVVGDIRECVSNSSGI